MDKFRKKHCSSKCHKKTELFTQFICEENVLIPSQKPDIENLISIIVEPEVISIRVIDTPKGISAEGQYLTGKKLSIELKLRQKIVYVSKTTVQSVHVVENEFYKSLYIVIPDKISGSSPEHLLNHNYFKTEVLVENVSGTIVDERTIYKHLVLFIKVRLIPCFVLCYTENYNCKKSCLNIAFKDGNKKTEIFCTDNGKILSPQWSPSGQSIAFIGCEDNESVIYLSNIIGTNIRQITEKCCFKHINSFSWNNEGNLIAFTAYNNKTREIFTVNITNLEWKQLTHGQSGYSSIKPKFSSNGEKIAYIKSTKNSSDLFIMKKNGLGTQKLTSIGTVKDFDFENNSDNIAYVCGDINDSIQCDKEKHHKENGDEIILIKIQHHEEIKLDISEYGLEIKRIKFSPDNTYIAFIGSHFDKQDIYIFNLLENELINLTKNAPEIIINDFCWEIDSLGIYFSSNEMCYCNIYFIDICDKIKTQISNSEANSIKLSYRPKIL